MSTRACGVCGATGPGGGWLFSRLVDWSISRLVDWSIGRLVDWSVGRVCVSDFVLLPGLRPDDVDKLSPKLNRVRWSPGPGLLFQQHPMPGAFVFFRPNDALSLHLLDEPGRLGIPDVQHALQG